MTTFVDTSGLLAVLDADDSGHRRAARVWRELLEADERLVTSSYVLVETYALAQRRLGVAAVRTIAADIAPLLSIAWVDEPVHTAALAALLGGGHRGISLVDHVSFEVMRRQGIRCAFALDADFVRQGFEVVPAGRS